MTDKLMCTECEKEFAVPNKYNYIICPKCYDYYMGIEAEAILEMQQDEEEMYWRLYNEQHGREN